MYSQKSSANLDFLSSFLQKVITPELKLTSPDDKQLIQVSSEVIEGILGEESPENLPKFDENLRFFPPILEAIRTFVYPCVPWHTRHTQGRQACILKL